MRVGDGLLKLLGLCLLAGVLVAGILFPLVGAMGVVSNRASDSIDSISADLVAKDPPLVTTITDANGKPIAYLFDQYRIPTSGDQISPTMKAALISIEDRRFYEHQGVDWKGTIRAAVSNQSGGSTQGASTLTQQYVKNYLINVVYRDNKVEQEKAQEQTIARKLREARIALQLEQKMTKDEILTGYLNVVEFSDRVFGIGAAAKAYFGTTADKLTVTQSALLAGMVNNPVALDPWKHPQAALSRRNLVIDRMVDNQKLSPDAAFAAKKQPLGVLKSVRKPVSTCVGAGPQYGFYCQYVVDYLKQIGFTDDQMKTGGYTIKTSFDANATKQALQAVTNQVPKDTKGIANVLALVKPGTKKHQVTALVANRDYGVDGSKGETSYGLPSNISNMFGAGSVYKIFTSASALEKGMGINNKIDTPPTYVSKVYKGGADSCPSAGDGFHWYCVKNAGRYPPTMTLQQGLAKSPNTGFVSLEDRIGVDGPVDMATRLGMRQTMAGNMVGRTPDPSNGREEYSVPQSAYFKSHGGKPSFTLGVSPMSPLELANVGATLMSGGMWCPPTPLVQVLDRNGRPLPLNEQPCEQAVAKPLADTLVVGLSQDDVNGGTSANAASQFHWTRPIMGKTGTTQDHKSAAFLGAMPQLAGAALTFNDSPHPEGICDATGIGPPRLCGDNGNIYGGKVPARTWFEAMTKIMAGQPVKGLPKPDKRYVDGGPELQVPNVVGKSQETATNELKKAGYRVSVQEENNKAARGTVVGQTPRGARFKGETITIYVSTGYVPPVETEDPTTTTTQPPPSGGGGGGTGGPGHGTPSHTFIPIPHPPTR
ncbi:transglycosylase domain-containing protein [Labedaea rhizosphaerae]|uniref:transglycosylase domain-containing protein n=1 Tax=Labedaea rhizosphaerae TaxID=598644 RepID=UPI001AACA950|nr:transglycosylase domain-containing protein [Labedaea rhizosphaerae]